VTLLAGDSSSNIGKFDFMRVLIGGHDMFEAKVAIKVARIIGNPAYVSHIAFVVLVVCVL